MTVHAAAEAYAAADVPLIVVGGREYGTGSSRDWAAKGPQLLGVKAVLAESFERIHRANLVGMGILPVLFPEGVSRHTLGVDGTEIFDVIGLNSGVTPEMDLSVTMRRADGRRESFIAQAQVLTEEEAAYIKHGGILPYVVRRMVGTHEGTNGC